MLLKNLQKTTAKKASLSKLLLLLWPFYQFSQLPFNRVYLLDLVVILAIIFQLKKLKTSHLLLKPLIIFLVSATISLLIAFISGAGSLISILYLARLFLYSSLLFVSLPKKASSILKISFFMVPIIGLLQYIFLPDLRFLKAIGYDDHYFRLALPFLDPNYTGAVLAFIYLYSIKNIKKSSNKILLALSLVALTLTFSRISYLGLFVGLAYLFFKNKKLRLLTTLTLVGLVLLVSISPKPFGEGVNLKRTFSITARLDNLKKGFNLFTNHPVTGQGYNTLPFTTPNHSSAGLDNSFLFILATTGLLGFTSFIYLLYKINGSIQDPFLKAALLSLVVHSLSNNTIFYAPITILVFLTLNLNAKISP